MDLSQKLIGEYLEDNAAKNPDKTALIYEGISLTWHELDKYSSYMAYRMFSSGIKKGTHVGIWSVNSAEWVIVYFALVKIGAVPVLLNTCYRADELIQILNYAQVEYLYYGDHYKGVIYADVIEEIRNRVSACKVKQWVPMITMGKGYGISECSFEECEKTTKALQIVKFLQKKVDAQDIAGILFTSGTTAQPKGVMLTHYNIVNTALATISSMHWCVNDILCIPLSLFHCFGLTSGMLATVLLGATMCILPYYRTVDVLQCIQKNRCTVINGVPSMFLAMIKNPAFSEYDISSLKSGIIAGSPISCVQFKKICRKMPQMNLIPSYGQTETSPAVTFGLFEDSVDVRAINVGKVINHVEVRIVDIESETEILNDQIGEIQVRGYNVMQGYYHLSDETKAVFTEDGWLHTGDLGRMDNEGYLYIEGRRKEMIIRAGENISPHEVAGYIQQIPWIEQVVVIGVPAEIIQEEVAACVIVKEHAVLRSNEIREYLENKIAHYKIPTKWIEFEHFPLNASGKIKLAELKMQALKQLNIEN